MRSFVKHKVKDSDAKRVERSMLQPNAEPAMVDRAKPVGKRTKHKS